ncbi:thioredoxin domain-containing protein [Sphingomonas sp. ASV193]|uniref:DsbA family protein n=1 Tax=Sphingomonas sp. ASV193 TaxID=3144405 RepID=UPI0032E8A9DD
MTRTAIVAALLAMTALTACKKEASGPTGTPVDDSVNVTQAAPPPGGSWADVANATAAGGVMMGNPNAKVKLIEIGSLSCPHCKKFDDEGVPPLIANYVKTGQVSWELRPYVIHGALDVTLDLIARCNGTKGFFPLVQALYHDQDSLLGKLQTADKAKLDQIQNLPPNQAFVAMAGVLGLQEWAAQRGVPRDQSTKCLTDQKGIDQEVKVAADVGSQYPDFSGTPSFIINGKMQPNPPVGEWAQLEPLLKAALK